MHRHVHDGRSPFYFVSNFVIWVSAVVVMGIVSYLISQNNKQSDHIIYEEVISVLTVVFFLIAFFLGAYAGFILLFNLIFSYLWLVAVVFTVQDFTNSKNSLLIAVEAFSFIAFFFLLFNVLYDWNFGYRGRVRTSHV